MNQEVLDALTELQKGQDSVYVSMDAIVERIFAMKNDGFLELEALKISVRKSLTYLHRNGILEKSGNMYTRCQVLPEASNGVYNTRSKTGRGRVEESDTVQKSTPVQVLCVCCRQAIDSFYKTYQRLQKEAQIQMFHDANPIDNAVSNSTHTVEANLLKKWSSEPYLSTFDTTF